MKTESIIIVGAGGHAKSSIEAIESDGRFEIIGLIGLDSEVGQKILGYSVLGTDSELKNLRNKCKNAIIGIGQITSPKPRMNLYEILTAEGFNLPSIIAKQAHVSKHAKIGEGSTIMPGALVMPGAEVGKNSIVNSRALIEHDSVIGDHTHIATGGIINGGVIVGDGSFVGSNTVVKQGIRIGNGCVIGMGMTIFKDVQSGDWVK